MTKLPVEIALSDDEGNKNHDDTDKRLVYKHKNGIVELHSTSLDCLQKGSYLKDNVVQFYLTYLVNEILPHSISSRVHIFDNILFNRLQEVFSEERIDRLNFRQLHKWYQNIDLFQKDFLIFPICYDDHWIVVVVCYARAVKPVFDEDDLATKKDGNSNVPGIMIMDSLDLRGPKKVRISLAIRDFLDFAWRSASRAIKRFSHYDIADYYPKLPKQTNHFDCGLFMLMYVKCFLEKPDDFYKAVRDQGVESGPIEPFSSDILNAVEENGRDAIKAQINKVCS